MMTDMDKKIDMEAPVGLKIEFAVRDERTEKWITFSDNVNLAEINEWFTRAGMAVYALFGSSDETVVISLAANQPTRLTQLGFPKINTIKSVREITHCGLKEAKDIVEGQHGTKMFSCKLSQLQRVKDLFGTFNVVIECDRVTDMSILQMLFKAREDF